MLRQFILSLFAIIPLGACLQEKPLSAVESSPAINVPSDGVVPANWECESLTVVVYPQKKQYTWIEVFADGHRDTVWSIGTSGYPGSLEISYRIPGPIIQVSTMEAIVVAPQPQWTLVCPGDSLWNAGDGAPSWKPGGTDTLFLNYGPDSLEALVEPRVRLDNKEELRGVFDTLRPLYNGLPAFPSIMHFKDDSLLLQFDSPGLTFHSGHLGDGFDLTGGYSCENIAFIPIDEPYSTSFTPIISLDWSSRPLPGDYSWRLVVSNRFGYADTLAMSTTIQPLTCSDRSILIY